MRSKAFGHLTIILGCSPQITSRIIPPPVAVIRPDTTHKVGANPLRVACCAPTTQNAANPKIKLLENIQVVKQYIYINIRVNIDKLQA